MVHLCPACRRTFDEPGFCPFDGSPLATAAAPDQLTVISAAMPAAAPAGPASAPFAAASARTDIDPRRGTFPLTPSPPAGASGPARPPSGPVSTQEVTSARTRVAPPTPTPDEPRIRALSASENPSQALEAYRVLREHEYDKLVGQTLDGRYFVEKKIGEGGMGVVFSARHAVIERPLAIKVLKREVMRDTATIRRFVQEAKAASRIGHPNIVDVTDFGTTPDGMTYSVMEFVVGQTLGAALRHAAPFPVQRAIRIATQIARALGAAHDKGIVHRDLKPENVFLLDRDGRTDFVKIVDFGIAKVLPVAGAHNPNEPRLTRAGSVFGTPEYMAPEQAAGRGDTDGRVDIYALGVIMYEMLTGRVPHRGDSMVRTLAMQMLDQAEPPSKVRPDLAIPPGVEAVVMSALAKKRDQRYQTMGELLAAIDRLHTPIGHSVTGTPVYALSPLPPGADAIVTTPMPVVAASDSAPIQVSQPVSHPAVAVEPARAKSPTGQRRLRDEPEFVTHDKPITFEHVFTEEIASQRRRGWPLLLLFALILGGAAGAIALVARTHRDVTTPIAQRDAGVPADAPVIAELADARDDDAPPPPLDATDIVLIEDAAHRVVVAQVPLRDGSAGSASLPVTPNGRGTIMIQVLTKPEGATLYVNREYRGVGGTTLEEALGTRLDIRCTQVGYEPGVVSLVFDGETEAVLCVLKRIKRCVKTLMNPFDECDDEPARLELPAP